MTTAASPALKNHPEGGYRFLPGIAPYSCGVVAAPGYEIVHATLGLPVGWRDGFEVIARHLAVEGGSKADLCAVELRSPRPFTFPGFAAFNADYAAVLQGWGVFVDGVNPVARTNVAPEVNPPPEVLLHAFSYAKPSDSKSPTFVVAGAGELPEGVLEASAIIAAGDTTLSAITRKAAFVMGLMENRLHGLGGDWGLVTAVDVYTIHPFDHVLPDVILNRIGSAAGHGVRWYYTRPPIVGIEFEMDVRGVRTEVWAG